MNFFFVLSMNMNCITCITQTVLTRFKYNLSRSLCTETKKIKATPKRMSRKGSVQNFLSENEHLAALKKHIPKQYFAVRKIGSAENLYLICPNVAKTIASHIKPAIGFNQDQIVAETNAGLGLITIELLESGIKPIRLYESCPDFRSELKDFGVVYPGEVELFTKDIFHLDRYSFIDKQDHGNRVELLLKNVPKKSWNDDPVMTIVGSMPSLSFIRYLIKCLCLQNDIATYGRFQIFALLRPKHYAVLNATPQENLFAYQYWTVLFNLLFDYELLEKLPRNVFLPWESSLSEALRNRYPTNLEPDKMYLVKINFKKDLPLATEHLLPLFYFGKHFYGRGSSKIIPTIEKWVPGCGLNILLPKLEHPDYFEDIDICTQFRELTPLQLLAVFKEIMNYPSYGNSPFIAMIESNLLKSETIETDLSEATPSQKNVGDIEQKFDIT